MLAITKKERIEQLEKDVSELRGMIFDLVGRIHEMEQKDKKDQYFG